MEDPCSPLTWAYHYQVEGIEELKQSLPYTTFELETTILAAQEELARKEDELMQLKEHLTKTIKERDEAQTKWQALMVDKFMLQQQLLQQKHFQQLNIIEASSLTGTTSNEDEPRQSNSNSGFYSDCDENITLSPVWGPIVAPQVPSPIPEETEKLVLKKPLPEKGKFLQTVMEAGPLLQTLLLAGPLPQWQHPPPKLNSIEIPPVTIPSPTSGILQQDSCANAAGCFSRKRGPLHVEGYYSSPIKYQKVVHQSPLTNI